jgi:EAL domain-containing protein (putative c-di-GMP-specific phosphodiesterase class I)
VELDDSGGALALGEDAWRQVLRDALSAGQAALAEFPLIDMNAAVVHLECPLRLPLQGATTPAPAAEWLPMAKRTQLTAQVDLVAVELALKAIARDNMSRAVNLSPRSLQDSQLIPRLRACWTPMRPVPRGCGWKWTSRAR